MTDYQVAKARFNQLPPDDCARPTSLSRRNSTLIATYFSPRWDRKTLQRMMAKEIRSLFPNAQIHKVRVDKQHITRCYFSLSGGQ